MNKVCKRTLGLRKADIYVSNKEKIMNMQFSEITFVTCYLKWIFFADVCIHLVDQATPKYI